MVFIRGKVSETSEKSFKLLCDEIIPISEVFNRLANGILIVVDTSRIIEDDVTKIRDTIKKYPGNMPLFIEVRPNGNGTGLMMRSQRYNVAITKDFLTELQNIIGKNNIQIKS